MGVEQALGALGAGRGAVWAGGRGFTGRITVADDADSTLHVARGRRIGAHGVAIGVIARCYTSSTLWLTAFVDTTVRIDSALNTPVEHAVAAAESSCCAIVIAIAFDTGQPFGSAVCIEGGATRIASIQGFNGGACAGLCGGAGPGLRGLVLPHPGPGGCRASGAPSVWNVEVEAAGASDERHGDDGPKESGGAATNHGSPDSWVASRCA